MTLLVECFLIGNKEDCWGAGMAESHPDMEQHHAPASTIVAGIESDCATVGDRTVLVHCSDTDTVPCAP